MEESQLIARILLIFMPEKYQPDYVSLRHVRTSRVHLFSSTRADQIEQEHIDSICNHSRGTSWSREIAPLHFHAARTRLLG